MWHNNFQKRLQSWTELRTQCQPMLLDNCLKEIDNWWVNAPWCPYSLHIDDYQTWPNPWELLNENHYCDLAKALGIVYTLMLMNRSDINDIKIADTDSGNLVLIDDGKYILNWGTGQLLNISSTKITIKKTLSGSKVVHLLG
jgi:hypothetical protein